METEGEADERAWARVATMMMISSTPYYRRCVSVAQLNHTVYFVMGAAYHLLAADNVGENTKTKLADNGAGGCCNLDCGIVFGR